MTVAAEIIKQAGAQAAIAQHQRVVVEAEAEADEVAGFGFVAGDAFILDAPKEIPAIWGDGANVLWARGEALMVVGGNGVGKTTLAHQLLAGRLGLRDQVLGFPVRCGSRRTLYLACDRPAQISRAMQRLFTEEQREILGGSLIIWKGPPPEDFAKNTSLLLRMCEAADADTVIVDSLKDVAVGLVDDTVGASYNRSRQKAIAAGVEVIELHHQVKRGANGGTPNKLADVYGSTWITAGAGSVVLLHGEAGDAVVDLHHLKQPADEVGPFKVAHDHATGVSTIENAKNLLDIARHFPNGMAARAAAEELFGDVPSASAVEKARRRLDKLVKDGDMVSRDKTRPGGGKPERLYYLITEREERR